jgi:hypothetical protein
VNSKAIGDSSSDSEKPEGESAPVDRIVIERVDWWLAEVSPHGYAGKLCDGPHDDRAGVEQALHLIRGLGLERGRKFCCVRMEQTSVEAKPHDTNEEALRDCRMLIDRSTSR